MDHPLVWLVGGAAALYAFNKNQTSTLVQQATSVAQQQVAQGVAPVQAAQVASTAVVQRHFGGKRFKPTARGQAITAPRDVINEGEDIMTGGS